MNNEQIENAKRLCMERDAYRCRHCGTGEKLEAYRLAAREGRLGWQLANLVTLCPECLKASKDSAKKHKRNRVGIMLCGGRGTRLYPLTKFQNKHTLPIGLVPMLFYPLKTLRAFGVSKVLIVIDREGADDIISMLGGGKEFGMDISYKVQEGAGGISEALYLAKDFAKPDDEIVVILGDNVFDIDDLDTDVDFKYDNEFEEHKFQACVYLKEVSNPEDYGVAVLDDVDHPKTVTKIVEKPKEYVSDMAVVGLYVYTYDVFGVIESVKPSDRGELEISNVNDHYASRGTLLYKEVRGYWGDAGGSIQRYAECSMHGAKKANVSVEEIDEFRSIVFEDK